MIIKTKILFISSQIVHNSSAMAGNQTFNFYLTSFSKDNAFEVGYVVVHKNDSEYQKMESQFSARTRNFSVKTNRVLSAFNYIIYNTAIRHFISFFIPEWFYMNSFYTLFYLKGVKKAKKENWVPDVIVLEWTESLFMYDKIKKVFPRAIYICSEHDVAFVSVNRMFSSKGILKRIFSEKFKRKELSRLIRMNGIAVHNKADYKRLLINEIPEEKLIVISPYFSSYRPLTMDKQTSNTILFFGAMNRNENIHAVEWFIKEVFVPFKLYEGFIFTIVGGKGNLLRDKYAGIKNIHFTGYVEDPTAYFQNSLCMVAPVFYGAGIKVKVIEGMASGLPVLTTSIGIEGIEAKDQRDYFLCNTADEFYNCIITLKKDISVSNIVGKQACKFIEKEFNYHQSYQIYKTKVQQMLKDTFL